MGPAPGASRRPTSPRRGSTRRRGSRIPAADRSRRTAGGRRRLPRRGSAEVRPVTSEGRRSLSATSTSATTRRRAGTSGRSHEPYLAAVLDYVIAHASDADDPVTKLVVLGDLFDFWTYPPEQQPPTVEEIINDQPADSRAQAGSSRRRSTQCTATRSTCTGTTTSGSRRPTSTG